MDSKKVETALVLAGLSARNALVAIDPSKPFFTQDDKNKLGLKPYVKQATRRNAMSETVTEYGKKLCTLRFSPDVQGALAVQEQIDHLPADASDAREFLTRKAKALSFAWPVGQTMPVGVFVKALIGATSTIDYVQHNTTKVGLSPSEAHTRFKGLVGRSWFSKCFQYETGVDKVEGLTRLAVNVNVNELSAQIAAEALNDALTLELQTSPPEGVEIPTVQEPVETEPTVAPTDNG